MRTKTVLAALILLPSLAACVADSSSLSERGHLERAHPARSHALTLRDESGPSEADQRAAAYVSPYSTRFSQPVADLIPDILSGPRGNRGHESRFSREDWDSAQVRRGYGAWGPPARQYPAPDIARGKSAAWKRERLLATALLFTGLSYQHHHIPDWRPPENWPWLHVGRGKNEQGVDCSNFTSFAYNLALGIKLNGEIVTQSRQQTIGVIGGPDAHARRIERPESWEGFRQTLRPGDLLYIRHSSDEVVSHVVLWMGENGVAPDGVPLVLDSTGTGHRDANGAAIPDGIRLRPFTQDSWYFKRASHALRFLED